MSTASDELYERACKLEQELAERKRLEVELQLADKLRAVGLLAAGVAHEINTPIQFIGDSLTFLDDGFAEVVTGLAAIELGEDLAYVRNQIPPALARCRDGVERVATIVRALKNLAHPDGRDQELADLEAAIKNTLIVVANELKYVADIDLAASRLVRCHVGEVQQVFLNLFVNAAHAIAERVGASGERGRLTITTRDEGSDVVIAISDDGAGIPDTIRARIFEPFFTTKPVGKGTGQGLAISHSLIVDRHGGQISFESTTGRGTTFTIRLPVAGKETLAATDQVSP